MSNPTKSLKYFKVKKISSELLIEFNDLNEFHRFVDYNQIRFLLLFLNEENLITHFAVNHQGAIFQQDNFGYQTLEDFLNAVKNNFPDSLNYYTAKEKGYQTYNDYMIVEACGINDKTEFDKIKSNGFLDGFADYTNYKTENEENKLGDFNNAFQLFKEAINNGFETYSDFKEVRIKGFNNKSTYNVAKEKGYNDVLTYETGQDKGFLNHDEYKQATDLQIRDRIDMLKFVDLKSLKDKSEFHDQRVLLTILSKLPQGKKVSINKLNELLENGYEEFKYADTNEFPLWFIKAFEDKESVVKYLKSDDNVKEFGHYDNDGEFFETKKLQERKVMIDGSNVAHNSKGKDEGKPLFANILLMVRDLKKRGISEITVISDAALKYRISDKELLDELKEECEYLEAPAEVTADVFLIKYVKEHHCLLISNDTFREWKNIDPWIAGNIDYYRLTFMINKDKVLIPDLE